MVKRYTLSCPSPDGFAVEPFDADLLKATVIVRGTDYDALAARLAEAERLLQWVDDQGRLDARDAFDFREMHAKYKTRATDSAPAALDLERVDIHRCPTCGALPRPSLMGGTVCPNGHGNVQQPMPTGSADAAPEASA